MKILNKKNYFLILFLIVFLFFSVDFSFAIKLEVDYPRLPSGEIITPTSPLTDYVRYWFNFGILFGIFAAAFVIFLGGIRYIFSAGSPEITKNARDRIFAGISGLILLLVSYLIIVTINPDLSALTLTKLEESQGLYIVGQEGGQKKMRPIGLVGVSDTSKIKPPKSDINFTQIEYKCSDGPTLIAYFYNQPSQIGLFKQTEMDCGGNPISIEGQSFNFQFKQPGVYLYQKSNCEVSDPPPTPQITSISDLGDLKNRINSARIVQKKPDYYIGFLYDLINYQGKCIYINPTGNSCDNLNRPAAKPFGSAAASVSIYPFSYTPEGEGVIFYRKPFFDKKGGSYKVGNEEIQNKIIYVGALNELYYTSNGEIGGDCNVPIKEQDCEEWNIDGYCIKRKCPNLAGENISSIRINGNYFVILIQYDSTTEEFSFCQGFPTSSDTNKEGPNQIKWEYIQRAGNLPNYVIIFPVKSK